jgi:hypothetical protein
MAKGVKVSGGAVMKIFRVSSK